MINQSALAQFNRQQNIYASLRDYLIKFTVNLTIGTPDSIKLQASSLAQLTQSTNQLTRTSLVERRLAEHSRVLLHDVR